VFGGGGGGGGEVGLGWGSACKEFLSPLLTPF
jgi:hypothetical protein